MFPKPPNNNMKLDISYFFAATKIALIACVFSASSCTTAQRRAELEAERLAAQEPVDPETLYSYWDDTVGPGGGSLRVRIDLSEQTAYVYRSNTLIGRTRVATGTPGRSTPTGSYRIMEKTVDKRSNLYGQIVDSTGNVVNWDADSRKHSAPSGGRFMGAEMPYWMRLTSYGIGMHVGPIPSPGNTASHGCIRMRREVAEPLFANAGIGTRVTIVP